MSARGVTAPVLVAVLALTGCTRSPAQPGMGAIPPGEDRTIQRVVDGDTVIVARGTKGKRVRLIGIDTPETVDPRRPVGCFGHQAAQRTFTLVPPGTPVRLVYDVERTDQYGRTLAYLYRRPDGLFVNAALVAEGYAAVATYPPNVAHAEEFAALAARARESGIGLWGACSGDGESGLSR
jgi:endonuclease YncB( thermonuclease family)